MSASKECVLAGINIVHGPTRSTQTMTQGCSVRFYKVEAIERKKKQEVETQLQKVLSLALYQIIKFL
jgi:hypothetical protein